MVQCLSSKRNASTAKKKSGHTYLYMPDSEPQSVFNNPFAGEGVLIDLD
jgi:hypothetical protein